SCRAGTIRSPPPCCNTCRNPWSGLLSWPVRPSIIWTTEAREGPSVASHFDGVAIGSGAGGATLAQRLAPTGKSILILERGEHLPREAENWDPRAVFIQHRYRTQDRWYDKAG